MRLDGHVGHEMGRDPWRGVIIWIADLQVDMGILQPGRKKTIFLHKFRVCYPVLCFFTL